MAALPTDRSQTSIEGTGWQDMRQQLFGQQRAREAEARLIRALGEIHARLNTAMRGSHTVATAPPKVRGKVLQAIVDGANQLVGWHRDELLAGHTAGRSTSVLPNTVHEILAEAQAVSALFEGARVDGHTIDCSDVVLSIASLAGTESDAFFDDALAGAAAALRLAFERIATDPLTAPAAEALGETWNTLLADVESLAIPLPEPAPEPAPMVAPDIATPIAPPPAQAVAEELAEAGAPKTSDRLAAIMAAIGLDDAGDAPLSQPATPAPSAPPARPAPAPLCTPTPVMTVSSILAARFGRIQLVAC